MFTRISSWFKISNVLDKSVPVTLRGMQLPDLLGYNAQSVWQIWSTQNDTIIVSHSFS